MFQWGQVSADKNMNGYTVWFPVSFPTVCLGVMANCRLATNFASSDSTTHQYANSVAATVRGVTNSLFLFCYIYKGSDNGIKNYLAIGF